MDRLELKYVSLCECRKWDRNPKLHSISKLVESIERYGFKDPMKFEPKLNEGAGGFVEGNGRTEALELMKAEGKKPPRGIGIKDGEWLVPVLFGVDAKSKKEAEAYGIDHNNLTILGGDFGFEDISKMWGNDYNDLLKGFEKELLPVSIDLNDFTNGKIIIPDVNNPNIDLNENVIITLEMSEDVYYRLSEKIREIGKTDGVTFNISA